MIVIQLKSIAEVKNFCNLASELYGDVDVKSEKYIVNGKSIMGLFSLDLTKPLEVTVHEVIPSEKEQFESQLRNYKYTI